MSKNKLSNDGNYPSEATEVTQEIYPVETAQDALEWFKLELIDGKCKDDCPHCNAYEFAIKALQVYNERI